MASASDAFAQACCATPSAFAPARLRIGENALVGLVASGAYVTGSFGSDRSFRLPGNGSREIDLGQRLFVAWAPWTNSQLSLTLPFVETVRAAGTTKEASGGFGDARLASRWTIIRVGEDKIAPGVQVLSGVVLPTGVPADSAHLPLATDATGVGAFQLENGLALEQSFGRWLVNITGTFAWRGARSIGSASAQLGILWSGFVALSYTFPSALSIAASAAYEASGNAKVNGVAVDDSATAKSTLGLAASMPLARGVRLIAGLSWNPHVPELGKNELATFGGSIGIVYAWGAPRACPMHPGAASCDCAQ
ncbi:hypothetical protein BH09MYX1_BH09MYX1_11540 [soil metagenome]